MNSKIVAICACMAMCTIIDHTAALPLNADIDTQVLRLLATKDSGYYHKPWKTPDFVTVKGSAFFFKDEDNFPGRRGLILTNAHGVSMAQSVKVSNGREKRQYEIKLLGICNSADFAVLQMDADDLATYERINGPVMPLELGDSDTLRLGDKVTGWGYPLGGERLSKSEQGEISRIEVSQYAHSLDRWLMVQASLQQNRGNSGGPVLKDGKVVGIAFQGMRTSDRINFFIPINLVKNLIPFLDQQELIPHWKYVVQGLFPRLKNFYNLPSEHGGVLLDYIIPGGGPQKFGLADNDIMIEIDGYDIDNFGEIYLDSLGQKVYFGEILNRKKVGDVLTIKVVRGGRQLDIKGKITHGLPRLVPRIFTRANYFIYCGIGFVELTLNCIENLGKSGEAFRSRYQDRFPEHPYQKIVIISEIFPEYGLVDTSSYLKRVTKIDDYKVLNVENLYDTIRALSDAGSKKALLELDGHIRLPIDLVRAKELDNKIQEKYGILYMKTPGGFGK